MDNLVKVIIWPKSTAWHRIKCDLRFCHVGIMIDLTSFFFPFFSNCIVEKIKISSWKHFMSVERKNIPKYTEIREAHVFFVMRPSWRERNSNTANGTCCSSKRTHKSFFFLLMFVPHTFGLCDFVLWSLEFSSNIFTHFPYTTLVSKFTKTIECNHHHSSLSSLRFCIQMCTDEKARCGDVHIYYAYGLNGIYF